MEQCLSLISVIKDRWEASSSFLEEKETIFKAFNTLEPILRDASRASDAAASASSQCTEAVKGVLDVLQVQLKDLRDEIIYCEKHTFWTTWLFPNKHKGKLVKLISNIQSYLPMLTLSISNMINEATKEIKADTTKIKDTTSDTNFIAKELKAQMEDLMRLFGKEVDGKKLQEIQTEVFEDTKEVSAEEMERLLKSAQDLEKKGQYEVALLEFVKYYAILQKQGKEVDDVATAAFYYEFGAANENQGQYPKAIEFHQKALDIRLKTLGKDDVKVAYSYNGLGSAYRCQGNSPKAIEYHEKALAIRLKTLGAEHPDVGASYNNLGLVYDRQGNYPKAIEYHEKSLAIRLKTLGAEHPATKSSQKQLSLCRNK